LISASSDPAAALTVVKYTQWPHGATLRLTNQTQRTITYDSLDDEAVRLHEI
jgi:hypothetical protein